MIAPRSDVPRRLRTLVHHHPHRTTHSYSESHSIEAQSQIATWVNNKQAAGNCLNQRLSASICVPSCNLTWKIHSSWRPINIYSKRRNKNDKFLPQKESTTSDRPVVIEDERGKNLVQKVEELKCIKAHTNPRRSHFHLSRPATLFSSFIFTYFDWLHFVRLMKFLFCF